MEIRIGTCGYVYDEWKGILYPKNIRKENMIKFYSDIFKVVEIKPKEVEDVEKNSKDDLKYFVKGKTDIKSEKLIDFSDRDLKKTKNYVFMRLNKNFYKRDELLNIADKIFSYKKDIYVVFSNHKDGNAVKNAIFLQHIVRNVN